MKGANRLTRRDFLKLSGAGAAGVGLLGVYGCGGSKAGATEIVWASWANPGEAKRFQEYTDKFNEEHPGIELKFTPTPNFDDYHPKILTQLNGGTAPDAFYTGDTFIGQFIENDTISKLDSYMTGPISKAQPDDYYATLWGAAKEYGNIYGIPVDCNPLMIWYNKGVLKDAGINDDPLDLFEKGEWKWDVFQSMSEKVSANGKDTGYFIDNANLWLYSWVSDNGGTVYDGDKFVANEDPKAVAAYQWLYDNLKNGTFGYGGTLPTGQTPDAQFMANQCAFVAAGRWLLPVFKENKSITYDVVPMPTNTDNDREPNGIPVAWMVMNKKASDAKKTFTFITDFTSPAGQKFRLETAGNAVPSVRGVDDVVLKGGLLKGAKYFLDVREDGFVIYAVEARVPSLSADMQEELEKSIWLPNAEGDVPGTLDKLADMANTRIQQHEKETG